MSTVLPVVNVKDLPSAYDEPAHGVGLIESQEVTPSQSGEYQRVHLVLKYANPNGAERTAHIRFNLKPEWLSPAFAQRVKAGQASDTESLQYRINVAGLWRGLFAAAGLGTTDLAQLPGRRVGFVVDYRYDKATGLPKNDAPEIQQFFAPDKLAAISAKLEKAAKDRAAKNGSSTANVAVVSASLSPASVL